MTWAARSPPPPHFPTRCCFGPRSRGWNVATGGRKRDELQSIRAYTWEFSSARRRQGRRVFGVFVLFGCWFSASILVPQPTAERTPVVLTGSSFMCIPSQRYRLGVVMWPSVGMAIEGWAARWR
ncbi:hypothetical protein LX36DRAFT_287301 [Colletotrichum falcatum]|nr:hypothetical protein LX36DRAFT_287301 [Colletotrichum falcatum]